MNQLFKVYSIRVLLLILLVSCEKKQSEKQIERPNILFIMTDDHAIKALSAYEGALNHTPNLDRIAAGGLVFNNSFVANSICAPSRATMLTGKFTHINGQINNTVRFDSLQWTFPKALQKVGYQTALVGKWHLKSQPTGFDYWEILTGQGHYYSPDFITENGTKRYEGYVTTITTDKALDWLKDKRDTSKPFCMLLHHKAPHRTWMPDTTDLHIYDTVKFPVPETYFDSYEGRLAAREQKMSIIEDMDVVYDLKMLDEEQEIQTTLRKHFQGQYDRMNEKQRKAWDIKYDPIIKDFKEKRYTGRDLALWKYQRYMEDYLATVNSVDRNVGRVLDYLEENNLMDNTIIVYTSDQGFYLGEHGWFDKRFMYEESFKTPLVMKFPKHIQKTTGEIEALVQNIDYAPTFLHYAGAEIPEEVQGHSLHSIIEGTENRVRKELYYHYYEFPNEHMVKRHYGIRTEKYKLIHFYNDIDEWELYDLQKDPNEMNNLYHNLSYKEVIVDLKQQLQKLQEAYQDTDRTTY
ncbi:sulfatase [Tamlana sp. 2201CG12-4]|uniref:sulfatase family protein n=1 Tax=Tamlana sp. 2201CG12-4 TaxID=3112582 RepID=UPI002DB9D80F|nr:sulfatase [Tamlana sp. 2201CG12-4]MEC3908490.1 sulfatase [Tamlana sp. 2201CG12-4]